MIQSIFNLAELEVTRTIYKGLTTYLLLDLNVIFSPDFSIFLQITQTQALVGTHATHIH